MAVFSKMVDMASSPAELKEERDQAAGKIQSKYPYGLCISFDDDILAKLDLDPDDAAVGDTVSFEAEAKVTSVSQNERTGDDGEPYKCCRVELQITGISMEAENEAEASMANSANRQKRWYRESDEADKSDED